MARRWERSDRWSLVPRSRSKTFHTIFTTLEQVSTVLHPLSRHILQGSLYNRHRSVQAVSSRQQSCKLCNQSWYVPFDIGRLTADIATANGIPIEGWVGDASDECLLDLLPLLDSLRFTTDVRRVLGLRGFGVNHIVPNIKETPRKR